MAKVVVIGANGQLGTDLISELRKFGAEPIGIDLPELDVCDHVQTRKYLTESKPDIVINTAAYHRVDEMEDFPDKAFAVNSVAVYDLALVCRDLDCKLMHMSTDYVFGGDAKRNTPLTETDLPHPQTVYGVSKLAGEYLLRHHCPKHFLVRGSGLYGVAGAAGKGGNFVELMIRLASEGKPIKVVNDQRLTPTFTLDLARKMIELAHTECFGLFHMSNRDSCTWFEFAAAIFELCGLKPELSPTTTAAFGAKATRPAYSVFAHNALENAGLKPLRPWRDALHEYLRMKHPELVK